MPTASRCFNPRTHEGCDKASELGMIDDIKFQSTHPRGVRHQPLRCLPQRYCVSIHAPTRGATELQKLDDAEKDVSIHAPTRGATGSKSRYTPRDKFQSTHPRGVRHESKNAPRFIFGFNPRTHEGCDVVSVMSHVIMIGFNPRTHEGCDLLVVVTMLFPTSFNPRTHEGCDIPASLVTSSVPSFNPRTHEGCDWVFCFDTYHIPTFQSTHPRGVRLYLLFLNFHQVSFNPRTHEGCDPRNVL